jgi:hypothetical protein
LLGSNAVCSTRAALSSEPLLLYSLGSGLSESLSWVSLRAWSWHVYDIGLVTTLATGRWLSTRGCWAKRRRLRGPIILAVSFGTWIGSVFVVIERVGASRCRRVERKQSQVVVNSLCCPAPTALTCLFPKRHKRHHSSIVHKFYVYLNYAYSF